MPIRPASERLQSFIKTDTGKWQQSPELKKVLDVMQKNTNNTINIEVAPSPMLLSGQPAWGSGNGVYYPKSGRAFVDPYSHPTVGAHEAAHQAFMSPLGKLNSFDSEFQSRKNQQGSNSNNFTPSMIDSGANMRMAYEILDKPFLIEEANAQGVTTAAMKKAGIPIDTSGWKDMYEYPEAYRFGGSFSNAAPFYMKFANKPGIATFTPEEAKEFGQIQKSAPIAVRRQFDLGFKLIK